MSLGFVLLFMGTANVSSRVRTIAYRMYQNPVRYSIDYLCNVIILHRRIRAVVSH
jgi:hypothetical protein